MNDLIPGRVHLLFSGGATLDNARSGQVQVLGYTGAKRYAIASDVPTIAESGVPGFDVVSWYGVHTGSKVPRATVDKINREINRILALPEVHDRLSGMGMDPAQLTAEQFNALTQSEVLRWAKIIKASGITQE